MGGALNIVNIITDKAVVCQKNREGVGGGGGGGEHTATMVSNREERREHQQVVGVALEERIEQ